MTADARARLEALVDAGDADAMTALVDQLVRAGDCDALDALGDRLVATNDGQGLARWLERIGELDQAVLVTHEAFDLPPVPDSWRLQLVSDALGVAAEVAEARVQALRERGWIETVEAWLADTETPERSAGLLEGRVPDLELRWSRLAEGVLRETVARERARVGSAASVMSGRLIEHLLTDELGGRVNHPDVIGCRGSLRMLNDPHFEMTRTGGTYRFSSNWMTRRALELAPSCGWSPSPDVAERVHAVALRSPVRMRAVAAALERTGQVPAGLRRLVLTTGAGQAFGALVDEVLASSASDDDLHSACVHARGETADQLFTRLTRVLAHLPVRIQTTLLDCAHQCDGALVPGTGWTSLWVEILRAPSHFDPSLHPCVDELADETRDLVRTEHPPRVRCDALALHLRARLDAAGHDRDLTDDEIATVEFWASYPDAACRLSAAALWRGLETNPWPRLQRAWTEIEATRDDVVHGGDVVHEARHRDLTTARERLEYWLDT